MTAPALVVKLGGSLAAGVALPRWLAAIGAASGRAVVVPGGGPFADAVRALQPRLGFTDSTAHALALLAMAQYGLVLAARAPALVPAGTPAEIGRALGAGRVPVWLPPRTLGAAEGVPESWDVTSDSLALWLAARLGAPAVLLVKSASAGADLLDAAFGGFRARYPGKVFVAGPEHLPADGLDPLHPPGRLLD